MPSTPTVDESFEQLHRAGWSVSAVRLATTAGPLWMVDATTDRQVIIARAPTEGEAWRLACEQARALGMLGA